MPNPVQTPTHSPTQLPTPRPYFDPETVREPAKICPQQRREEAWEAV